MFGGPGSSLGTGTSSSSTAPPFPALEASAQGLAQLLLKTASQNVQEIKAAQQELERMEETMPQFGVSLLQLLHTLSQAASQTLPAVNPQVDAISHAGGIYFKNYVKRKWPLASGGVPEADRKLIKQNLVALLMMATKQVQRQLSASMELIAECDFPFEWENLIPDLKNSLRTVPHQKAVILEALEPVLRTFEDAVRSTDVLRSIKYCVESFAAEHLQCFRESCQRLQSPQALSLEQQELELRALVSCCALFHSLNVVDLPEEYEDTMKDWFGGFLHFLKGAEHQSSATVRSKPELWAKLRTQICENLSLYVTKYQEEVKDHVTSCTAGVWQLLLDLEAASGGMSPSGDDAPNDLLVASGIKFLSAAAGQNWGDASPFADQHALKQICEKIVIPNIKLRQCDVELFEDAPLDFIQRDIEEADQDTRRKAAIDLVKALMRFQEKTITDILMAHVRELLTNSNALASAQERFYSKESCIYVVMAMAVKGSTRAHGCTIVNGAVPVQEFFEREVVPILQGPIPATEEQASKEDFPPLRAACMKFATTFRTVLSTPSLNTALPLIAKHVQHPSAVVHTYAAHAVEKLVISRDYGAPQPCNSAATAGVNFAVGTGGGGTTSTQLQINTMQANAPCKFEPNEATKGLLTGMLEPIITLLCQKQGIEQNEYLMRCVVRIFSFLKQLAVEIATPMLNKATELMEQIAANPKHPHFAHFLFEGVAVIIRIAEPTGKLVEVEDKMLKVCGAILQGEVMRDFLPYVFQILGLLLDSTKEVKPVYQELFGVLMMPEWWSKVPNIPALVRLLKAYLNRHTHFRALLDSQMDTILRRFEALLNHRRSDGVAFDLLAAIFAFLPLEMYEKKLSIAMKVALSALMQRKHDVKLKKHFVLAIGVFSHKYGAEAVVKLIESLQSGLAAQIVENVWLPALDLMLLPSERKNASISLARILFVVTLSPAATQLAMGKLARLLGLAGTSGGIGAEDGGQKYDLSFEGTYSKLSNADAADGGDYFKEIGDYRTFVKQQLQPFVGQIQQAQKNQQASAMTLPQGDNSKKVAARGEAERLQALVLFLQ
ncbi:unnamed protein product [Amoebophrya sp. A25]|nr:unnamed protein product [Amoebophrya sp. A25]|eukprot:GSA25T00007373001.1